MTLKKIRHLIIILTFITLSFGVGFNLGKRNVFISWKNLRPEVSVVNREVPVTKLIDFSLFWNVWDKLAQDYLDKTALDPQKMVWGAISGMVSSLGDPYTVFLPPKENTEAKQDLQGIFEGVGIQLGMKDKKIIVVAPLKGMPAEKAGIKAGDWIVKVDGADTFGWTLPETVSKIRGQKGTKVTLTILHDGDKQPVEITLVREIIQVPSVELEIKRIRKLDEGIEIIKEECATCSAVFYLKVSNFGDKTNKEWEDFVNQIVAANSKEKYLGLILDLRNNPGGYLQGAVFLGSEFLNGGIIVAQESADGSKFSYLVERRGKLLDIPLVVLVNKGSASAAEILAGTLGVRKRGTLVGEKTFGKGTVQEAEDLPGGAGLHITTARWLLPNGQAINGKGIEPEIKVEDDIKTEDKDEQLEKALEVLIK